MKTRYWLPIMLLFSGCKLKPSPIEYGADACEFCKMTIVDLQHGAEVVTHKGRVYKFDAIECMINYAVQQGEDGFALFLANDFAQPGALIDARAASFLISRQVPSPMGACLSAFADTQKAQAMQSDKGGELFTWMELLKRQGEQGFIGPKGF